MHFGRIQNLETLSPRLPPNPLRTQKFLALKREFQTQTYFGCPIWASKSWANIFYPPKMKSQEYLKFYSEQFNTVEVNSTFYHLLDPQRISAWKECVNSHFRFCPKVYRGITENLANPEMPLFVKKFCDSISQFKENLGVVFAQFSESFTPQQFPLLLLFLKTWPKEFPLAIELRHPSWFQNNALIDEVIDCFYRAKVSAVITDTPGKRDVLHLSLTQPKVFIRFQGHDFQQKDQERLVEWSQKLREWEQNALQEIYFFVHYPEESLIPPAASFFSALYEKCSKI